MNYKIQMRILLRKYCIISNLMISDQYVMTYHVKIPW